LLEDGGFEIESIKNEKYTDLLHQEKLALSINIKAIKP